VINAAPDYIEPVVGWRIWTVAKRDGVARLSSPMYFEPWEPQAEFAAECNLRRRDPWRPWRVYRSNHLAPDDHCNCGVYGMREPDELAGFFQWTVAGPRVHYHVFGRVSLWGEVIEGTEGWRASRAYPAELWLPQMDYHVARGLGMDAARDGLADYGVPLHVCDDVEPLAAIERLRATVAG
jgi:hypothetical protein